MLCKLDLVILLTLRIAAFENKEPTLVVLHVDTVGIVGIQQLDDLDVIIFGKLDFLANS